MHVRKLVIPICLAWGIVIGIIFGKIVISIIVGISIGFALYFLSRKPTNSELLVILRDGLFVPIIFTLIILAIPTLILYGIFHLILRIFLNIIIWLLWCPKGKYIIFVYSDSPNWKEYISLNIIPKIEMHAIILNWSERKTWRWYKSLAVIIFRTYSGSVAFNPIAIVFRPIRFTKVLRFWKPFKKYIHGKPNELIKMQNKLFKLAKVD